MLFLIPVPESEGAWLPVSLGLVGVCSLAFLITWPLQQSDQAVVSHTQYEVQARRLGALLRDASSEVSPEDRAVLEKSWNDSTYPNAEVLSLFNRIEAQPAILSSETRYHWGQEYPLFQSLSRSYAKDPHASSIFERLGFRPGGDWIPGMVTHQFLHGGWLHLLFNMIFLWAAGTVLEPLLGGARLLALFLVGGIVAAMGQARFGIPSGQVMVGASGAIAALMGFSLSAVPAARMRLFYLYILAIRPRFGTFQSPLWFCLPLWILQQVFMLLMPLKGDLANVGYAAHVSGFAFGAVLGLIHRY